MRGSQNGPQKSPKAVCHILMSLAELEDRVLRREEGVGHLITLVTPQSRWSHHTEPQLAPQGLVMFFGEMLIHVR